MRALVFFAESRQISPKYWTFFEGKAQRMTTKRVPTILCILDGWGHAPESPSSAIGRAKTPNYDRLIADVPFATLDTSGLHVGLPDGQMGNSEVGHMNLGSGRVVMQDLPLIDEAIATGTINDNDVLNDLIEKAKAGTGTVHLMGLMSPGGVHSHQDHMAAIATILTDQGLTVKVHAFLDGRDTPPKSAADFVAKFEGDIAGLNNCEIATLAGRFYAMDRDKRWDRVQQAYDVLVDGKGNGASAADAIAASYKDDVTDEFILPVALGDYDGMQDGDAVLMANFRADRAREILTTLTDAAFDGFARARLPKFASVIGLVEYSAALAEDVAAMYPPEKLENVLGAYLAKNGKTQLHIAETEKYAHVTFFFNGGQEEMFDGEERILVPSPKVATYDLQPEMSAAEVTDRLVEEIAAGKHDFIVVNYANPDMVGHTGIMEAAVKAVETIDTCLGRLTQAVTNAGGSMLITADHGNVEQMRDPSTDNPHTAHTSFKVPLLLVNKEGVALTDGRLADIAPTVLGLMGMEQPAEMTGRNLVVPAASADKPQGDTAVA